MRNAMTVGLKLLGVLSIYWAASDTGQVVAMTTRLYSQNGGFPMGLPLAALILLVVGVPVVFALVLLNRTDWIVDRLKISAEPSPVSGMEPSHLLRVGLVILGAFSLIEAIPDMGRSVYEVILSNSGPSYFFRSYTFHLVVSSALKFLLGCVVIGNSERFARSVFPVSNAEPKDHV
jgi:hypothetical protein